MCSGAYVCRDVGEGSAGQVQAGGDGGHSAAGEEPRDTKGEVASHTPPEDGRCVCTRFGQRFKPGLAVQYCKGAWIADQFLIRSDLGFK